MIPPAFIQELLARVDIVDIVGRQVQLKKSGINFSGLCPFHAEKSPSFTVTPTKQFYHCFGCGANGDAIRFLVEQNGMTFIDAVKDLAQQVGMTVPDDDRSAADREAAAAQKERRTSLTDVLAKAAAHFRRQLKASPRAIEYLKGRGLSGEIAARFGLGYAPDGWRGLASVFPSYDDPLLDESGMVIVQDADAADESQRKRYDRFRDRIMFPIRSVQGDIIGFGGRVLDRGEPKYLNSPETPVFVKGRELYGLFEARSALRQRGYALVVEGYMDVVALAQSGFENGVATLGTACTAEHVQKLFRFTDSVVFSFDGDTAGRRAALRALEASLPHASDTRTIRFLFLPPEHDPDSFVREFGAEAFERSVADAVPLSRQLLDSAAAGCDLETAEGRAKLVAQAKPWIAQLPAGLLRGQIVDLLAERARIVPDELRSSLSTSRPSAQSASPPQPDAARPRSLQPSSGMLSTRAASSRRPLATMASSLDRAVWLVFQRADLWEQLEADVQHLLVEQPSPHGDFFGWLDRLVHEQGALAPSALGAELEASASGRALAPLHARIRQLHDMPAGDGARQELDVIVDRLRLRVAESELAFLAGSPDLSDAAKMRQRELLQRQRQLKEQLARSPTPGG